MHSISQGEESEGQHSGLEATHRRLRANEKLFVFHDNMYITSKLDRVEAVFNSLEEYLCHHVRIRSCFGKTHVLNQLGVEPLISAVFVADSRIGQPRTEHRV